MPRNSSTSAVTAPAWTPAEGRWSCASTTCGPSSGGRTTPPRSSSTAYAARCRSRCPYQGTVIGALNAYSSKPATFATPEALDATLIVAEIVAVAMVNTQAHGRLAVEAANLRLAMESRAVIEQAKGLIMSQRHVTAEQAFEVLREASMRYNRKAFFKQIRRSALAQCQLSVRLTDADGRTIRRPPGS